MFWNILLVPLPSISLYSNVPEGSTTFHTLPSLFHHVLCLLLGSMECSGRFHLSPQCSPFFCSLPLACIVFRDIPCGCPRRFWGFPRSSMMFHGVLCGFCPLIGLQGRVWWVVCSQGFGEWRNDGGVVGYAFLMVEITTNNTQVIPMCDTASTATIIASQPSQLDIQDPVGCF